MQNDYEEIEYTEDNLQHTDTQQDGEPTEKARVLGLIFSFLIPLLGILLFYLSRNKVINPNAYLSCNHLLLVGTINLNNSRDFMERFYLIRSYYFVKRSIP